MSIKSSSRSKLKYNGKIIGFGGFGDVFRPPLPCKLSATNHNFATYNTNDYVGKCLIDMKEARAEYKIQKKINKIDPHHLFTLCVWQICPITLPKDFVSKIVQKYPYVAGKYPNGPDYKAQIISDYGGILFPHYLANIQMNFDQSTFATLFIRIMFFIENMARMNRAGLFHFDIHESNVLFNQKRDILTMIDYGFVSHSIKHRIIPFLNPRYMGRGSLNVPPEIRFISGILYANKHLARATPKPNKKSVDFTYANEDLLEQILDSFTPPKDGNREQDKNFFKFFTRFSKWYKKPGDDALFISINSPIYDKILKSILLYARNKNKTHIHNVFDKKIMMQKFESWSMGFLLFFWFENLYSFFKKYTLDKKIIEYMLHVICNDMIQSNVSERLSIPQVFQKINYFLKKNVPTLYKDCKNFSRKTKKKHSQMQWCTHTKF